MNWRLLAVAVFSLLLSINGEAAETLKARTLVVSNVPFALKGQRPSTTSFYDFGPAMLRPGAIRLRFRAEVSEVVLAAVSSLHVSLDGVPMRTLRIPKSGETVEVSLGFPGNGYHALRFSADLKVPEESCEQDLTEIAWLKLVSAELSWGELIAAPVRPPVRDVLSSWASGKKVNLVPPTEWSRESVLAYLEARSFLAVRGVEVVENSGGSSLELDIEPHLERPELRAFESRIQVAAPSAQSLLSATLWLGEGAVMDACFQSVCFLSTEEPPVKEATSSPEERGGPEQTVLRLGDVFPKPWVASGEGTQTLTFSWKRPKNWGVSGRPRLELLADLPHAFFSQQVNAKVHAFLNEEPIDSWVLDAKEMDSKGREVRLSLIVPQRFHEVGMWDFKVIVQMEVKRSEPCAYVDPRSIWFSLDEDSALRVSREERRMSGVSGTVDAMERRPSILWNAPGSWVAMKQLAPSLVSLASLFPAERWRWEDGCERCMEVVASSNPPGMKRGSFRGEPYWVPQDGEGQLPLVPLHNSLAVSADGDRVRIHTGNFDDRTTTIAVPWTDLLSENALLADKRWVEWGEPAVHGKRHVESENLVSSSVAISSDSQSRRVLLDVVWIVLVGLIGVGSWMWIRQRKNVA